MVKDYDELESEEMDSIPVKDLVPQKQNKPKQKRKGNPAHAASMKKHKVWEKSPYVGFNGYIDELGQKAKITASLLEFENWGPVDLSDVNALEERFQKYLNYCIEHEMVVSNLNAYNALGISKITAGDWENGRRRDKAHTEFIKKVKRICSSYREQAMAEGILSVPTGIFWQKNFDGFTDNQTITIRPENPLGDEIDPAELQKRIEGNVIIDDDDDD